jgi:two-component system response regulator (stage 0 sporulation protein A)
MKIMEMKLDALMRYAACDNDFEREKIRLEVRKLLCETDPEVIYHEKERQIRKLLLKLNAPDHMNGFPYLVDAILLVMKDEIYLMNMSWGIYSQIAKKYQLSNSTVQRGIANVVDAIWDRAPIKELQRIFPGIIEEGKGKTTVGTFIARISNLVKYDLLEGDEKKCR